jgi:TolB-like protein
MRKHEIHNSSRTLRHGLSMLLCTGLAIAALSACKDPSMPRERPTLAVLPFEAQDAREETRDLADHLTRRLRTILASRPEVRVIESRSAMHFSLTGMDLPEKAERLDADYVLTGAVRRGEGRVHLSLQLVERSGEESWNEDFESPLLYQAQLQDWVLDKLWTRLPLEPQALEAAHAIVESCHYPGDAMAILTLARTGRRGGGPASLAMVATADIEAGLLHLAQSQFYFSQLETLPESQKPVIEKLARRSLGRAAASCPEHPRVELLRLIYTDELQLNVDNAAEYLARHPNSADLYLAVAELQENAGSHRKARVHAREAVRLDPLGKPTRCRAQALAGASDAGQDDCP